MTRIHLRLFLFFFFQAEDGIRDVAVTGVQTCALPICGTSAHPSLRIDNRRGARLAVEHLLAHGHREIAFISGPPGNSDAAERQRGYNEALRVHGLRRHPRLELVGDFSEESGALAGRAIARLAPRPTAVFAANDAMAVGCLAALRESGLEVPGDVSLVGFDDI